MLALWDTYRDLQEIKLKNIVFNIWVQLYIGELDRYFTEIQDALTTEHGLAERESTIGQLGAIQDAYIGYWHLGRLGILNYAPQEFMDTKGQDKEIFENHVSRNAERLTQFLHSNPAILRPLLDIHHVELFLQWLIFWQATIKERYTSGSEFWKTTCLLEEQK